MASHRNPEAMDVFTKFENGELSVFDAIGILASKANVDAKTDGTVYTPRKIVEHMISLSKPKETDTIIEPSCGRGSFLFPLLEYAKNEFGFSGRRLYDWFVSMVSGIDISKDAIGELKTLLDIYFKKEGVKDAKFKNVIAGDSLFVDIGHYDLCIGNPPYIRTKNIEADYLLRLRDAFSSCKKGNIDIYYAFIERFRKASNKICFIVPNGFLSNKSGTVVKEQIFENLTDLIDFQEKRVFENASTYTAIFCSGNVKTDFFRYSNDLEQISVVKKKDEEKKMENKRKVYSGIATLCDKVFLAKRIGDRYFTKISGYEKEIEPGILAPYYKLTKAKSGKTDEYMIFPYSDEGIIIDENDLKTRFPKAYGHLSEHRRFLDMRDKGKVSGYEAWYAFGRKQGFHFLKDTKVIVVQQMMDGDGNMPKVMELERFGGRPALFTSGFLIPWSKAEEDLFLGTSFFDYVKKVGKPWPGKGKVYYTVTSKILASF